MVKTGRGRKVEKQELLEIKKQAEVAGLVTWAMLPGSVPKGAGAYLEAGSGLRGSGSKNPVGKSSRRVTSGGSFQKIRLGKRKVM